MVQADYFQGTINKTTNQINETENPEERMGLEGRVDGLREARNRTLQQRQLEETREAQEEGINRLQKFKKWAEKNIELDNLDNKTEEVEKNEDFD